MCCACHACAPDQFDVTIRAGRIGGKLPLIMGHEIAGEVAALGRASRDGPRATARLSTPISPAGGAVLPARPGNLM